MPNKTKDQSSFPDIHDPLNAAIEECVRALEAGNLQIESLVSKYPQFASEIVEFLENWGGMESVAVQIGERAELDGSLEATEFVPHRFGSFQLLEKIGSGGMGTIYKAKDLSLDRIVAIKTVRGGRKDDARFQLEAEAAAALDHPNIVSIYEVGEQNGRSYISMQFVDGWNLKEYLDSQTIDSKLAATITETIAHAVHHAHQRGVLHRDLKPANVLLDVGGTPFVTDFGLAKVLTRDIELTQQGAVLGTPGYMAPEQASPELGPVTLRTDVYGLGALLYALLTGEAPFTGDSSLHVLRQVLEQPVASPRGKNKSIDRDLETICMKCLEKAPETRYESAEKLADDLGRFLRGVPVKARPATPSEKLWRWCKRNPVVASLALAVVALLLVTTVFASWFAYSERNSRLLSQENALRESGLNKDLNVALARANRERADLLMTNGLWQASNHNIGEALLWFSEAAMLQVDKPEQLRNNLIRCQSWLREHPLPIATAQMVHIQSLNGTDEIEFQPGGSMVLYRNGAQSFVWNPQRNDLWHVNDTFPNLSSTAWSPDGTILLLASRRGLIAAADPTGRSIKPIVDLGGRALEVANVNSGKWLAVSSQDRVLFLDSKTGQSVRSSILRDCAVRKLVTDSSGTRLIVINVDNEASVFSIADSGIDELFSFRCSVVSVFDNQRPFWPRLVMNDKALLARVGATAVVTFDIDTGEKLAAVEMPTPTYCVGVSPDGKRLSTGSYNYGLHFQFPQPTQVGGSDNKTATKNAVASNASRESPNKASSKTMQIRSTVRFPHDNVVMTTAVRGDGMVATGGWNNEVRLWKTQELPPNNERFEVSDKAVPVAVLAHQNQVRQLAFSNDGRRLVTIQIDGLMRLWAIPEFGTRGYEFEVEVGGSLVKKVGVDRWLASGSSKWTSHMEDISVIGIESGKVTAGVHGYSSLELGSLLDSAVSPDGKLIASVHAGASRSGATFTKPNGAGGWLRFWSTQKGTLVHAPIPMPSEPRCVVWHPSGKWIAVCTALMQLVVVDAKTFEVLDVTEMIPEARTTLNDESIFPRNEINEQMEFSKDGKSLVVWSTCKPGWSIWDFGKRQLRFPVFSNKGKPIGDCALSPDGNQVAIAGGTNPVAAVFDLNTGQQVGRDFKHASAVNSVSFKADGEQLVTGCRDGHARVFEWPLGKLLFENMTHGADVVNAVFTLDSKFILTLGRDNQLRVWNSKDGSLALCPFPVATGSVQLVVSEDSRFVIVGGGQIRVVDLSELRKSPEIDLGYVRRISELLSNKTIVDSAAVTLSSEQWMTRLRTLIAQ